jgi:hypothetical protein
MIPRLNGLEPAPARTRIRKVTIKATGQVLRVINRTDPPASDPDLVQRLCTTLAYARTNNVVGYTIGVLVRNETGVSGFIRSSMGDNEHMMMLLGLVQRLASNINDQMDEWQQPMSIGPFDDAS